MKMIYELSNLIKPQQKQEPISCAKCGGHNNPYSRFCIVCGSLIAPTSNMNSAVAMMVN